MLSSSFLTGWKKIEGGGVEEEEEKGRRLGGELG